MVPNQLREKLDRLSEEDLGIPFKEAEVWSRLEARLNRRSRGIWIWRAAAVLLLGMVSIPFSLEDHTLGTDWKNEPMVTMDSPTVLPVEVNAHPQSRQAKGKAIAGVGFIHEIVELSPRKIEIQLAAVQVPSLVLAPIEVRKEKMVQPQFAAQDISMIQASLETGNIEQGRKMAIRAQWQKSSTKSNVEFQALKIKLYEKNE